MSCQGKREEGGEGWGGSWGVMRSRVGWMEGFRNQVPGAKME